MIYILKIISSHRFFRLLKLALQMILLHYTDLQSSYFLQRKDTDDSTTKILFLNWIQSQGNDAWISSHIRMEHFPMYGYGLVAKRNVQRNDPLFRIPSNLIQSSDTIKLEYTQISPHFQQIDTILGKFSSLERQDIILALHFMKECTLRGTSYYQPYLDMLPNDIVPRLDTFDDHELYLLEDEFLCQIAKESRSKLKMLYNDLEFQRIIPFGNGLEECTSFPSFHKFVTISSSHSMILNGTKFLVPLADMINHSTRPDITIPHQFQTFHRRNNDGSITVYADRDVMVGEQIFEDYGTLDSSLFLEAHGFVPSENPFHCAVIESRYLLEFSNHNVGLADVLFHLRIIPSMSSIPDVCVTSEGRVQDAQSANLLRVLALGLDNEKLGVCIKTKSRSDCIHYDHASEKVSRFLRLMAGRAYCTKRSSLDEDVEMLESLRKKNASSQSELALRFRIADKRILSDVSGLGSSHVLCDTKE